MGFVHPRPYRRGALKKRAVFATPAAASHLGQLSKQAIIDIAYNLALRGTNETEAEAMETLRGEAVSVCSGRGDRLPKQRLAARGDA